MTRLRSWSVQLQRQIASALVIATVGCCGCPCESNKIKEPKLEVTQAIQDNKQSVQLVSDRSTAVRVRVGTVFGDAAQGITGELHVFVDGTEITDPAGVPPINAPFSTPVAESWDRDHEHHTLNFELPKPTGISASENVDFVVVLHHNGVDREVKAKDLTFDEAISPTLYFTPINYPPADLLAEANLPDPDAVKPGVGDSLVRGIYPVDDSDEDLYLVLPSPPIDWNNDPNGDGWINGDGEESDLLDKLASHRCEIVFNGIGCTGDVFLYGWLKENPIKSNGWGTMPGRVAFGNTDPARHQRTYAHELGHNFGLDHPDDFYLAPDTGWDTAAPLVGTATGSFTGANPTARVKKSSLYDVMVPGQLTASAWVDVTTYQSLLKGPDPGTGGAAPGAQDGVWIVSGVLSGDGSELVRLNPTYRYPWRSRGSADVPDGEYLARVVDDQGIVYETIFSGRLGHDGEERGEEDPAEYGFFAVRLGVPVVNRIEEVSIVRRDDEGRPMGVKRRSKPPEIRIDSPPDGATLDGPVELEFTVTDPDPTPLDQIRIQFAYSSDGGATWVPLAVNVPGSANSVVFDTQWLLSTDGNDTGLIRATASDDLNTVHDLVSGLTVNSERRPAPSWALRVF